MSSISVYHTLFSDNWNTDIVDVAPTYTTFYIGINNDNINLNDLQTHVRIQESDIITFEQNLPRENTLYVASDQNYIDKFDVTGLKANTKYKCTVSIDLEEYQSSYEFSFITGIPIQPFASWQWNGEEWKPPVVKPNDGYDYVWSEHDQMWEQIDNTQVDNT